VITIPGGTLPSSKEVRDLVKQNLHLVKLLQNKYPHCDFTTVLDEMNDVQIDPEDLVDFLEGLSLRGNEAGTHFLITPANEEIRAEIERERQSQTKEFSKLLLGFCNSTFSTKTSSPMETAF